MSVNEKMTALADAIREKSGVTGKLTIDGMTSAVKAISSLIVASASGNPIVLNDSTDLRVQSLRLFGKTTQNGTPTPEAPVPLVSAGDGGSIGVKVTGKNRLNYAEWRKTTNSNKCTVVWENNGVTLTATGNDGFTSYSNPNFPVNANVPVVEGETITLSWEETANVAGAVFIFPNGKASGLVSISNSTAKKLSYTVAPGITFVTFRFGVSTAGTTISYKNIQIETGSTATAYEPYKEAQTITLSTPNGLPGIPVTTGGNYTDETGQQWVCDEVDFGRGVYVQRIFCKTITDFSKSGSYYLHPGYTEAAVSIETNIPDFAVHGGEMCSHFEHANSGYKQRFAANVTGYTYFVLEGEMTHDEWRAKMTELSPTVYVPTATPIEIPLSAEELAAYAVLHTNYPNTTLLNDGGAGMEVQYVADTKLYIDNKINAMAAAIVNA